VNKLITESEIPFWKKIKTKVRYGLTLQAMRSVLMRFGIEISPFYIFREEARFAKKPPDIEGSADYSVEELGRDDMKLIGSIYEALPEEKLLGFLDAGEKCIALKYKGEIVSFVWINFNVLNYGSTVINLKSNEAYMWFGYTLIPYRGKNLIPYLRYNIYEILIKMNRDVLYSVSDCFNSPAVRFKEKLNARKVSTILYINLFKKIRKSYTLRVY
jgi:hypothetical protein